MDASACHIRRLEVTHVPDEVHSAESTRYVVAVPEPIQDLDIEVRKMSPAWEAVVVRIAGNNNLADMLCCNAVAVIGPTDG